MNPRGREALVTSAERLLQDVQERLKMGGIEEWQLEGRWIVEDVLGSEYSRIRAGLAEDPTDAQMDRALECVQARLDGTSLAHVLGYAEFYGLRFRVVEGVMVPRTETETLVDAALDMLEGRDWSEPRVLDCYTGCGNVLISIMAKRPGVFGVGIDIDPDALTCAEANRESMGCSDAVFVLGDVSEQLERMDQRFHLVTANPPYVRSPDIPGLPHEISAHERHRALDGGPDGMKHYRILASHTPRVLEPGGFLLAEIGADRQDAVAEIFADWHDVWFLNDLSGHPRVLASHP